MAERPKHRHIRQFLEGFLCPEKSDEDKTDSTDEDKKEDEEETEPKKAKFEEDYSEFFK